MAKSTGKFNSKIGVIAATVGSAIGLGNIWRFPAETQTNGGAAFLMVYIVCIFLLGIPVMLAELSLGRAGKSDAVGNFRNLTPKKKWWAAGYVAILATYLIMSFYNVVAGWTVEYLFDSITGNLYTGYEAAGSESEYFVAKMKDYIDTPLNPLIWTYAVIIINFLILLKGVDKGIEKMANILMPLLFVLMLVFCGVSLTLPGAIEGVKFFVMPDFSKITPEVVINALGQAFFSLSLGMGILVTYASYYPKDTKLVNTSVTVSMLDFLMAFLMGMIIFPAVLSFGLNGEGQLEGTTLVFVTMPRIFAHIGWPALWSSLFFLLLAVAALTSTVSGTEVAVAFLRDQYKMSRTKACVIVTIPFFILSTLCSLSLGPVPQLSIGGLPLFDALDNFATNYLLPLSALAICLYVGWVLPKGFIKTQLTNKGKVPCSVAPLITFLVRYICPLLIALILVWSFV